MCCTAVGLEWEFRLGSNTSVLDYAKCCCVERELQQRSSRKVCRGFCTARLCTGARPPDLFACLASSKGGVLRLHCAARALCCCGMGAIRPTYHGACYVFLQYCCTHIPRSAEMCREGGDSIIAVAIPKQATGIFQERPLLTLSEENVVIILVVQPGVQVSKHSLCGCGPCCLPSIAVITRCGATYG